MDNGQAGIALSDHIAGAVVEADGVDQLAHLSDGLLAGEPPGGDLRLQRSRDRKRSKSVTACSFSTRSSIMRSCSMTAPEAGGGDEAESG